MCAADVGGAGGAGLAGGERLRRVLLVEDDDLVRVALSRGLSRSGYQVWTASSAEEAMVVSAQGEAPFDILVTDLLMPGVNGLELARALLERGHIRHVLLVSGYPDDVVRRGDPLVVQAHCLQKPFTPTELAQKMRAILGGEAP
jgi:DNA-binding response OmpR family regulator